MSLEDKDKNALIKYRIERSEAALKAARREFEAEDMFAATNRIYYACFCYGTSSLYPIRQSESLIIDSSLFLQSHP